MPHDIAGTRLKEGDIVTVKCRVRSTSENPDYCNIILDTIEPMFPGKQSFSLTLNSRQVEIVAYDESDGED